MYQIPKTERTAFVPCSENVSHNAVHHELVRAAVSGPCVVAGRGGDCGDKAGDTDSGPGRTYVWTTQHHSVADYPDHWHHPVELLLSYVSMATNGDKNDGEHDESLASHCLTNKTENKNLAAGTRDRESSEVITSLVENRKTNKLVPCVVTRLPQALPLNCTAQQLHRWRNDDATVPSGGSEVYYGGRLKVVCSQGVIYRFVFVYKL